MGDPDATALGVTLRISARQMAELDRATEDRFIERLIDALHGESNSASERAPLIGRYRQWIVDARTFEFTTEYELAVYVECCERFGADFASNSETGAPQTMKNAQWPSFTKAQKLQELCKAR